MLNVQKDSELYNHDLYKQFSNYCHDQGLLKLAKYYYIRGEEEKHHHDWIIHRLRECNYPVVYLSKPEIKETWDNLMDTFDLTILRELETTKCISDIAIAAFEEHDLKIYGWLFEKLIPEQHEEESNSLNAKKIAQTDSDWLTKEQYILDLLQSPDMEIDGEYDPDGDKD